MKTIRMVALSAFAAIGVLLAAATADAQKGKQADPKPDPKQAGRDSQTIQDCVKSVKGAATNAERCIGRVADPCLKRPGAVSNADMIACISRESSVWDDILNETFRRLNEQLDAEQKVKLRDMQGAWIDSRDRTCAFYYDYHQGSIAVPMGAFCVNRETARRALFLLDFLNDAEGR
jgi:uncharacterized protein YecT (DUF1311 family)